MAKPTAARTRSANRSARKIAPVRTGKASLVDFFRAKKLYALSFIVVFMLLGGVYLLFQSHAASQLPDPLYSGGQAPWIQPIGTNPVLDPNSAKMVSAVDSRVNPTMNAFGMPFYTGTSSDPTCTVQDADNTNQPGKNFMPIHIPSNAAPSTGSDHWLFVYDSTKNVIIEMWDTVKSGNCFSTQVMNAFTPTGDGVLQTDGSQTDGNGASYWGGVVSAADWNRGYINHALSMASQATYTNSNNSGRYPMNPLTDGNSSGVVPIGSRFFLDKSVNCDGLGASKVETMVCHAMQTYGGYMQDTGGVPMSIYFQENNSTGGIWSGQGWNENMTFSKIPWNQMHVLKSWNSYTAAAATSISSFSASPSSIGYNSSSTLSWSTGGASSCSISPIIGGVGTGGSHSTGNLTGTTTFTLSCSGNGSASKQLTVAVAAKPGSPSPSPSPSPSSSPSPSPSGSPSPTSSPSSTTTAPSGTSTSSQGTSTTTPGSNYVTPDSVNNSAGGSSPTSTIISTTAAATLPACQPGQTLNHGACSCPSDNQASVCKFAHVANPVVNAVAAITGGLLVIRFVSSVMGLASFSGDAQIARRLKRNGRLSLIGLGICVILYITLEFFIPGGILNR